MVNQLVLELVRDLKKTSKKNKASIWSRLAQLAVKPSSAKRVVNLTKINRLTKENDVIVVPGKVLGTGLILHKITLCSFSISNSAAKRILESGGRILSFKEMAKKFPTGKGVTIIG
ncbi:MAG: 50S ribosomal protein L18e [Nitrosopumilaceae archaeon]